MGFGANLLVTQLAWTAGHKALEFLPDGLRQKIAGSTSKEDIGEFLTHNRSRDPEMVKIYDEKTPNVATIELDENGHPKKTNSTATQDSLWEADKNGELKPKENFSVKGSNVYKNSAYGKEKWFYVKADDFKGGAGYTCMYLRVQGTDMIMEVPCVNGCPKISLKVIQNERPTASNEWATTNRRVKPRTFIFEFPIAYLRVYGYNDYDENLQDMRSALQKLKDKVNDKVDGVMASVKNKLGFDSNPIAYDDELDDPEFKNRKRERQIPTYSEVLAALFPFPSQFGCYLYTGLAFPKISVSCSMDIESQKGDMDCVWVKMTLIETQEFDFQNLGVNNIDIALKTATQTNRSSSAGKTQDPNANSVS